MWHTVMILSFRTDRSWQTVQAQIRLLIRVYTVCNSLCIFWTHYSTVKPLCNFRVISANFWGVLIFRIFTVYTFHIGQLKWGETPVYSKSLTVHSKSLTVRSKSLIVRSKSLTVHSKSLTVRSKSLTVRSKSLTVRSKSLTVRSKSLDVRS